MSWAQLALSNYGGSQLVSPNDPFYSTSNHMASSLAISMASSAPFACANPVCMLCMACAAMAPDCVGCHPSALLPYAYALVVPAASEKLCPALYMALSDP